MEFIVFILLSFLMFILGLLNILKKYQFLSFKLFIIFLIVIPSGSVLSSFIYKSQVLYFFPYFVGLIAASLIYKVKLGKLLFQILLINNLLAFLYFTVSFFLNHDLVYILKDLKFFIIVDLAIIFIGFHNRHFSNVHKSKWFFRSLFCYFIFSTIFIALDFLFGLSGIVSSDPYYKYNEIRYTGFGLYFILFYLIYKWSYNQKFALTEIILIGSTILYTGNRTIFFSLICVYVLRIFLNASPARLFRNILSMVLGLTFILALMVNANSDSFLSRYSTLLNKEEIERKLNNRFSPFTTKYENINSPVIVLFGNGMGETFEIPWFEYRENIDNRNIYIDNVYLTNFAKYGMVSLLIFSMIFFFYHSRFKGRELYFTLILVSVFGLTMCFTHQKSFFIMLVAPMLLFNKKKN